MKEKYKRNTDSSVFFLCGVCSPQCGVGSMFLYMVFHWAVWHRSQGLRKGISLSNLVNLESSFEVSSFAHGKNHRSLMEFEQYTALSEAVCSKKWQCAVHDLSIGDSSPKPEMHVLWPWKMDRHKSQVVVHSTPWAQSQRLRPKAYILNT